MDTTMDQLRSFVHQRLFIAAEEILGEVEKTVTLVLYEAEASRSKEELESLRYQLDLMRKKSAADASLSSNAVEHGDKCEASLLQDSEGPSTQEETNFSVSAEHPGLSQTSAYPESNNWDYHLDPTDFKISTIKQEEEELLDDSLVERMFSFSPEIGEREGDQPKTQVSSEKQPVSDCPEAESELDGSDEEWVEEIEKEDKKKKKAALSRVKNQSFCHVCGRGFQYIRSLTKHIKTHESSFDCDVCEVKCKSAKELITHMKKSHAKTYFCNVCGMAFKSTAERTTHVKDAHKTKYCCDVCGKTFANSHCLRLHKRIHSDKKDFKCQECSKSFYRRDHLIVHQRTHSGVKPYNCDICGKKFTQSQNLTMHQKSHSKEKNT